MPLLLFHFVGSRYYGRTAVGMVPFGIRLHTGTRPSTTKVKYDRSSRKVDLFISISLAAQHNRDLITECRMKKQDNKTKTRQSERKK
jgi:hypothetical protein